VSANAMRWAARLVLAVALLAAFLAGAGFNALLRAPMVLRLHSCPVVPEDFNP
jgi:hypothetical protein